MESVQLIEVFLFFFTIATAVGYGLLLGKILIGWDNTPIWETPKSFNPQTKISVIIAARNEEQFIHQCVESILANDYPSEFFEMIIVDDGSTDNTVAKVKSIESSNIKVISNSNNPGKKGALHFGISNVSGDLIITTDADSIVTPDWINSIVSLHELSKADLISGPIKYIHDKSLIQRFQYIDGINNMAVTANGIKKGEYYLANGANIAYTKELYNEIGGFEDDNIASGDDTYLIQSAAKLGKNIRFIKSKEAFVATHPVHSYSSLKNQRKRWATKTKSYPDKRIMRIQGYVFFFVLLLVMNLCFSLFGTGLSLFSFLFGLFIKLVFDYMYLKKLNEYFESEDALKSFLPASFLFLGYILIAGWWALFPSKYEWKERSVN